MGQIVQPAMLVYRESAQKIGGNICKNSPHRSPTCFQLWRPHVIASCSFWWGSFRWILRSVGLRTKPCCMPSSMTRCGDDSHGGIQHFKNIRSFFFGMLWWVLANFFGLALNPFWGFGRRLCWTFVVGTSGHCRWRVLNTLTLWSLTFWGLIFFQWEDHLDVSKNRGKTTQIIHFNRVFHYKPSILGYPYFWKHPSTKLGGGFKYFFLNCIFTPKTGGTMTSSWRIFCKFING